MCEVCKNVILRKQFCSPQDYLNCLAYLQQLIDSGEFELESATCALDEVKGPDGKWVEDIIGHVIRCRTCGQAFTCSCCTYRGGGSFYKGR